MLILFIENRKKFISRGNIDSIAMKKIILLFIISQVLSIKANLITKSSTNGKHINLGIYCTWYSLSVTNSKIELYLVYVAYSILPFLSTRKQ